MKPLTVFTPTYNRAHLLSRCYESMMRQTCKEFVWMIIDDGSTDGTRNLVNKWMSERHDFEIKYYYKKNGGLHTAYNEAIEHIESPLCVCIDSDDWMPNDAVEKILDFWNLCGSDKVAGIVGLDCYEDGKVIGDYLPDRKTVNLIDLLVGKYNIVNGDRTNVVRTELYRKYAPMKSYPGEKYFNPHYMHLLISKEQDFLVLNENLRFVEYQEKGMSNSIFKQYRNSPNSFAEIRRLYLSFPNTSLKFRLKNTIHLASSLIFAGRLFEEIKTASNRIQLIAMLPAGTLLSIYIVLKSR